MLDRRRALGLRIADHRRTAGLSQDQLADAVGLERRTIQRYEAGARDPGCSDLVLIAAALDTPLANLLS